MSEGLTFIVNIHHYKNPLPIYDRREDRHGETLQPETPTTYVRDEA